MCAGMPYIDLRDYDQGLVLVETVHKNMGGFTREKVEGAKLSRQTQGRVGNPHDAVFKQLIGTKDLKNNPVSHENISHAKAIFGPNISGLKGRATRKRPHRVVRGRCKIPRDFYLLNKFVTLTADVMFVCGIPFFGYVIRRN